MGLDTVELVMTIEESFDVQIPDDQAEKMRTVGDAYEFIIAAKQANQTQRDVCLSAATFYKIRRGLCPLIGLSPKELRPRTNIATAIPVDRRRRIWKELQRQLYLRLPSLGRPDWCLYYLPALVVALSLLIGFVAFQVAGTFAAVSAAFVSLSVLGFAAACATAPLAVHPQESFQTFRGLSMVVLAYNHAALSTEAGSWDAIEIWHSLRLLISDHLGVRIEYVVRDADFVKDFGV